MRLDDRVDPELKRFLASAPEFDPADYLVIRKLLASQRIAPDPKVIVTDRYIQGPDQKKQLHLRIYEPNGRDDLLPGLLWMHGGGMVLGTPESEDGFCFHYVKESCCVVVSVDYRLAPENPFPAALEDCYQALEWLANDGVDIGVDPSRIAVAGGSAGGGLAASVSLLARDNGGPKIVFQMPLYPMIDDRMATLSSMEITDNRVWSREMNKLAWKFYLGEMHENEVSTYAAPARAIDFAGLPPTYTFVGDLDLFRDETIEYITKLSQAGVPVEFAMYPGCIHGFTLNSPQAEVSQRALKRAADALKSAFYNNTILK